MNEIAEPLSAVMEQFHHHARENPGVVHVCPRCGTGTPGGTFLYHWTKHLQEDRQQVIPDWWEAL